MLGISWGGMAVTRGHPQRPWPVGESQRGRRGALGFHSSHFSHRAQPLAKDQNPALILTPKGNSMPGWTEWEPRFPTPMRGLF